MGDADPGAQGRRRSKEQVREIMLLDHLAVAGSALAQGLALRHVLVDALAKDGADGAPQDPDGDGGSARLLDRPVPGPGLDGRPAEWSLAALSYLGLIDAFLEPDPAYASPPPGA